MSLTKEMEEKFLLEVLAHPDRMEKRLILAEWYEDSERIEDAERLRNPNNKTTTSLLKLTNKGFGRMININVDGFDDKFVAEKIASPNIILANRDAPYPRTNRFVITDRIWPGQRLHISGWFIDSTWINYVFEVFLIRKHELPESLQHWAIMNYIFRGISGMELGYRMWRKLNGIETNTFAFGSSRAADSQLQAVAAKELRQRSKE